MPTFAAIDIGSNSVRLKISRLQAGRLKEVHEDREVTRLGEGVFSGGLLSPESMSLTVQVLRRFNRAVQECGTDSVKVVATAALRDARNARIFLEWVRSTTGWTIEIISGLEEARLIHLGILASGRMDARSVLLVDLGGGSCELTLSREGRLRDTVSLPLGAVRLTSEFLKHDPPRKSELKRLHEFVDREIMRVQARIKAARVGAVIATSGTAAALEAPACDVRDPPDDPAHCQTDHAPYPGRAAEGPRHRSASRGNHLYRCGGLCGIARALPSPGLSLLAPRPA
jgi:exopolyphosphatase/guanosine-5'-triphosphate,3'-diphosphate pyrophosphatase